MKKHKRHTGLIVTLAVILFIFVALFLLLSSERFTSYLANKLLQNIETESGLNFEVDSFSVSFIDGISVDNLAVYEDQKKIASLDSLVVSSNLNDFLSYLLKFKAFNIKVEIDRPFIDYRLENKSSDINNRKSSEFDIHSLLKRVKGFIVINDADISLYSDNFSVKSENLDVNLNLEKDLNIIDSSFSFDILNLNFKENFINLNKFKMKFEENNVSFIIDSVDSSIADLGFVNGEGTYNNGLFHFDVLFNPIEASFDSLNFSTSGFGLSLEYDILKKNSYFNIYLNLPEFSAIYKYNNLSAKDFHVNCNINSDFTDFILTLDSSEIDVLTDFNKFDRIKLGSTDINLIYKPDSGNSVSFSSYVEGIYNSEFVEDFSFDISGSADFNSFEDLLNIDNYSNYNLSLSSVKFASVIGDNSVSFRSDENRNIVANISLDDKLYGSINYSYLNKELDSRLYLSSFKFIDYKPVFNIVEQYAGQFASDDTLINGSIIYRGSSDIHDINGRASVNLVGQNFVINNQRQSVALSFEANAFDNIVSVNTLALTAFGKRLSYNGLVDLTKLNPEGSLMLQDSNTFEELVRLNFNPDQYGSGYYINADSKFLKNCDLSAHVDLIDKNLVVVDAEIETNYITYPLSIKYDIEQSLLDINSDDTYLNLSYDEESVITVTSDIINLPVYISDSLTLLSNGKASASYNLSNGLFSFNFDDFELFISDILKTGFNLYVDNNRLSLSDLDVDFNNVNYQFGGIFDVSYKNIEDLINYKDAAYNITLDLKNAESQDFIFGTFNDGIYSLDIDLTDLFDSSFSVLGSLNNGFYADCRIGNIDFFADYKDGSLEILDGQGEYQSLKFEDIGFNIDFNDRNLFGSFYIENEKQNFDSIVRQGGEVQINAKLDSLVLGALNLAGIDAEASFKMSIVDAFLGDGYKIADNDINVTFSRSLIQFEGELVNGFINPQDKYLELDIDKNLLFGLKAKGYYDDNLEIYLSDLYFPLQLIDQFINTPLYTTYGGIIEGELLLNGSLANPSFYGMLYSQAFNMGLLFIPNQNLSLKNVVITAVDHSFYISDTPVVGHSSIDGRYYDGSVKVELKLGSLSLDSFDLDLIVPSDPIDLWIPLILSPEDEMNIRGDVVGTLHFYYHDNQLGLDSDITASNADVTFEIDDKPEWMMTTHSILNCDVLLTSGKNVEFYYPNKNNSFINFTVQEGQTVDIKYNYLTKETTAIGEFDIKSGRISYINNDFNIKSGKFRLLEDLNGDFNFFIDLTSSIREFDYSGDKLEIYLNLQNANLNNINPRFSSIPSYSENEILQVLASNIIPSKNEKVSVENLANAALITAKAATNLGIIDYNKEYSLTSVVRDSLGLDVFAAKSNILENFILDSLSTKPSKNSLLAKYLNGTTVFAGKYIGDEYFARLTLLLKSPSYGSYNNKFGSFLTSDLNLDFELSIEWDNPIGEFSVFTKPQELSVLDFLDNIGFSVTKRFNF